MNQQPESGHVIYSSSLGPVSSHGTLRPSIHSLALPLPSTHGVNRTDPDRRRSNVSPRGNQERPQATPEPRYLPDDLTALIVSALSFFDLVPAGKVTILLLAVLAVLAFSALQTRTAVEGATFQQDHSPQFLADFPADLRTSREQAMDWFRSSYGCTITPR